VKRLTAHARAPSLSIAVRSGSGWACLAVAVVLLGGGAEAVAGSQDPDAVLPLGWPRDARPASGVRETRRRVRPKRKVIRAGARVPPPGAARACLQALGEAGVRFVPLGPLRGVRTPVEVVAPIGGVALVPRAGRPARMDCELARALAEAAPLLRRLRVDALSFSGAYDYRRRRRSRKLSEHAHGLAIDVHAVRTAAGWIDVERSFARDPGGWRWPSPGSGALAACVGAPAAAEGRLLRTVTCSLALHPAFHLVLTPDYDRDHHNHFHLEAHGDSGAPLLGARTGVAATRSGLSSARRR
jgi:hypothetical protein